MGLFKSKPDLAERLASLDAEISVADSERALADTLRQERRKITEAIEAERKAAIEAERAKAAEATTAVNAEALEKLAPLMPLVLVLLGIVRRTGPEHSSHSWDEARPAAKWVDDAAALCRNLGVAATNGGPCHANVLPVVPLDLASCERLLASLSK